MDKNGRELAVNQKLIRTRLAEIYSRGIISIDEYNELQAEGHKDLSCILPNRMTVTRTIDEIYTPKTA
ncbi:MAG TPA: hypothetical protein VK152_11560, partial [Paludibacter sp.]|nr:hypothetical protein [Paludibacter sp.]